MEKIKIADLHQYVDKEIISHYMVTQKEFREGTRDFYIRMRLADDSGSMIGNVWRNAKSMLDNFQEGDVVKVKALVISYKGQLQLTVNKIKAIPETDYDVMEFLPATKKDVKALGDQFFEFVNSIENEYLKKLLEKVFDHEFFSKFSLAPAAKTWHHNYLGGLLEHSIGVTKVCEFSATQYPVNRDLLIAGGLMHDMGKVFEYSSQGAIDFTPEGRLLGHISIADQMICKAAGQIDNFPDNLLMKLRHLILSHHGEYEKASARLPQTIEAIVLHFADNMDAQTVGVHQLIEPVKNSTSVWSEFDRLNNRYYYIR